MNFRKIGLQTVLVATLVASGLSLASCRDDHPGYDSDRHGGDHDRDHGHDHDHDHDRHGE